MKFISLKSAHDDKHKYIVALKDNDKSYNVKFGAKGYDDYTKHKDKDRKERYLTRHKSREDWTRSGILSAGFWSKWVLWNKPSLQDSINDVIKRFNL